jgi:hypothetical protein
MPNLYARQSRPACTQVFRPYKSPTRSALAINAYRLRQNLEAFDTVSPPPLSVQGRPRKISHEAELGMLDFLDQNPTAYQDEIADFLLTKYEIEASQPTISRLMKKLGQTHKRIERMYEERDNELRTHWRSRLCE